MSHVPFRKPSYSLNDLDPQLGGSQRWLDLSGAVARRSGRRKWEHGTEGAGEINSWLYIGPSSPGFAKVAHPTSPMEVVILPQSQGTEAFFPGQRVLVAAGRNGATVLGNPPGAEVGLSKFPPNTAGAEVADFVAIYSASPSILAPGDSNVLVTISGAGFSSSPLDDLDAVIYNETTLVFDVDGEVTIHDVVFVSVTQITAQFDVATTAKNNKRISVGLNRGAA